MVTKGLATPDRIYAVGDVHGHADKLRALHRAIEDDIRARGVVDPLLVHLGDYIDRGPDSAGCIALLARGSPLEGVPTVNLVGNHERMLLDALDRPERTGIWLINGGVATLESWGISPEEPERWREQIPADQLRFIQELAVVHAAGRYLFVHAGVRPGIRLAMQAEHDMLWIRECFLDWNGTMLPDAPDRIIVHGHTPLAAPEVRPNRIGIDTNAGRGGPLTCAALSTDSVYFIQV